MRLTRVPWSFSLIILCLSLTSARKPYQLVLSTEELRKIVLDLVKSEVAVNLAESSVPTSYDESGLAEQLEEIQRGLNETKRQTEGLMRSFAESLEQTQSQCSAVRNELVPGGSTVAGDSADDTITIREAIQNMSSDLEEVKANLDSLRSMFEPSIRDPDEDFQTTTAISRHSKLSNAEFEGIVNAKSPPVVGRSYNGSTLQEITAATSSRGYGGRYITVEFGNWLNSPIEDLKLIDRTRCVWYYPPQFIPSSTKEVFTFREPGTGYPEAAFSYRVPSIDVRFATMVDFNRMRFGFGFIEEDQSLDSYYNTTQGIAGSSEHIRITDESFVVILKHRNLHARASFENVKSLTAAIKIELIESGPA